MNNAIPRDIRPGSVVQIDPAHDEKFGACLLLVTEVKGWGVQGTVRLPGAGDAGYRVKWEDIEYVGEATWVPKGLADQLLPPPSIELPAPFEPETRVTWTEGRTQRVRTGVIEAVYQQEGWSAEYNVRPLKADGTLAAQVQLRHHSELQQVS